MSIFDDIIFLKEHLKNKINWYSSAIERIENDIQKIWNEYFLSRNPSSIKLIELETSFRILQSGYEFFIEAKLIAEKKLQELEKQEYALISTNKENIN